MNFRIFKRKLASAFTLCAFGGLTFGASSALAEGSLMRVSEPNLKPYTIVDGTSIPDS